MKNAFTLVLGLFLTLSVALYSSVSMAMVGSNAVFSMEICADGVATTLSFDANGSPIEPAQTCPECLACCQTVSALAPTMWSSLPSLTRLDMEVVHPVAQNPIVNKRNHYPAPRGPPIAQLSLPGLITLDCSAGGRLVHSDGRSLLKDANA